MMIDGWNITCKCGYEAPFDDFCRTPINGVLPKSHYQCPHCNFSYSTFKKNSIRKWGFMIKHTPTMGRDNPYKYIKRDHPDGIYVQMYREGISVSKLFPKLTPLKEVVAYRDKMVAENALYFHRKKSSNVLERNKNLPVGVCTTFSKSKNGESFVVAVMVSYVSDSGVRKTKGFYVGTIGNFPEDKLEHAVLIGCAYREDYEYCVRQQLPFDAANAYYQGWQDKYLFDFTCESRMSDYE